MAFTIKIYLMTRLSGFMAVLTCFLRMKLRLSLVTAVEKPFALRRFCWQQEVTQTFLTPQEVNWASLLMGFLIWKKGRRRWLLLELATLPWRWLACSTTLVVRHICTFVMTSSCVPLTPWFRTRSCLNMSASTSPWCPYFLLIKFYDTS